MFMVFGWFLGGGRGAFRDFGPGYGGQPQRGQAVFSQMNPKGPNLEKTVCLKSLVSLENFNLSRALVSGSLEIFILA